MLERALQKLQQQANGSSSLEQQIGEYLTALCRYFPAAAAVIAESAKTLQECGKHLMEHARKNQKEGSYAMGQEALIMINEFYGLTGPDIPQPPELQRDAAPVSSGTMPPTKTAVAQPAINILDFLD